MSGKQKYTCNSSFFHNIDSEEKAYWLGFIMADGCIIENEYLRKTCKSIQKRRYLQISLSSKDRVHLTKFLNSIGSDFKIRDYQYKDGYKPGAYYSRVIIENKEFVDDLILHGIIPHKTFHESIPDIDDKYIYAYIRGFFDGDGCISFHSNRHGNKECEFSITGTKNMVSNILEYFPVTVTDKTLKKRYKDRESDSYTAKYCGNIQAKKCMDLLYKNANIYLDRKYNKYLCLVELNSRHIQK